MKYRTRHYLSRAFFLGVGFLLLFSALLSVSEGLQARVSLFMAVTLALYFSLDSFYAIMAMFFFGFFLDTVSIFPFGMFTFLFALLGGLLGLIRLMVENHLSFFLQAALESFLGVAVAVALLDFGAQRFFHASFFSLGPSWKSALLVFFAESFLVFLLRVMGNFIWKRMFDYLSLYAFLGQ